MIYLPKRWLRKNTKDGNTGKTTTVWQFACTKPAQVEPYTRKKKTWMYAPIVCFLPIVIIADPHPAFCCSLLYDAQPSHFPRDLLHCLSLVVGGQTTHGTADAFGLATDIATVLVDFVTGLNDLASFFESAFLDGARIGGTWGANGGAIDTAATGEALVVIVNRCDIFATSGQNGTGRFRWARAFQGTASGSATSVGVNVGGTVLAMFRRSRANEAEEAIVSGFTKETATAGHATVFVRGGSRVLAIVGGWRRTANGGRGAGSSGLGHHDGREEQRQEGKHHGSVCFCFEERV
jgi:hypothetical protein